MPIEDAELEKTLKALSLLLSNQSNDRLSLEEKHAKETALILTKISNLMGEDPDIKVENLGETFLNCIHPPPPFPPEPQKGAKDTK
jgi:hypothetical protein